MTELLAAILSTGAKYLVLGLAFSMVYFATKTYNLILGASFVVGALAVFGVSTFLNGPSPANLVAAILISAAAGGAMLALPERFLLRFLTIQRADGLLTLLATFAVYLIVENAAQIGLRSQIVYYGWLPVSVAQRYMGLAFTHVQLIMILFAAASIIMWEAFWRSAAGLRARMVGDDYVLAVIVGVNADKTISQVSLIAGALMGVAGFVAGATSGVDATMGFPALFPAIVVAIVAARPRAFALITAAISLAAIETVVVATVGQQWQSTFAYAILALALIADRLRRKSQQN